MTKEKYLNRNTYLLSLFIYNLARVLPHAILTVILLNKGMSISDIAVIQSFFMLAAIIFEFPSGFLTDIWSEKFMYQLSLILLGISYFITMVSNKFPILCISWFIYGMSSASMSGSLDSYFIRRAKSDEEIKHINVLINHSTLYSGLIGGGIGSFIYKEINIKIYIISLVLIFFSLILITFIFHPQKNIEKPSNNFENFHNIINDLKQITKQHRLIISIALYGVFEIITQLFFQFWQINFLKQHFTKAYFGLLYILFQVIAILGNSLFSKFDFSKKLPFLVVNIFIFYFSSLLIKNKILFLFLIILFLLPFNLYNNQLVVNIQKESSNKIVASVISLSETISSIVSVIILWIIGILNNHLNFLLIEKIMILIFTLLSLMLIKFYSSNERKN
ncbi:MFS transporter [Ligilactobacillus cholophilus]|uniref:MFS transporter n=1 Tax=Ligilactobacillus cholophilus TaxID=3050131 RepID=UPI0025AF5FC7|nr:MFS transporter [Ligilactobacillus cholophilus]